jgi:RNA polymerase sigma factor (sigma-70 family)
MSIDLLPHDEVKKNALKFLSSHSAKVKNNDEYIGEMISSAFLAMNKYDPSYGTTPSTLIYKYCRSRLLRILKRDKKYYERHEFHHQMNRIPSRESNPYKATAFFEQSKILSESGLTKRCQQVILERMKYPEDTLQELGERLGVSKQAVSQHINSAQQYFQRNNVQVQLYEDD